MSKKQSLEKLLVNIFVNMGRMNYGSLRKPFRGDKRYLTPQRLRVCRLDAISACNRRSLKVSFFINDQLQNIGYNSIIENAIFIRRR